MEFSPCHQLCVLCRTEKKCLVSRPRLSSLPPWAAAAAAAAAAAVLLPLPTLVPAGLTMELDNSTEPNAGPGPEAAK